MTQQERDPGPLPNRWLRCPRTSATLIADRFFAFKTPLSAAFKDKMPLACMFQPEMLFSYCKAKNIKLGLWIDLTNTKRFYDRKTVESMGAVYKKLQCRGHGETPSLEQTRAFIELVDEYLTEHPLDIIGVHCTHGFNRTGFLIVAYMVERLDFSVDAAITLFAKARPPGIYKQDYINELFKRFDEMEQPIAAPELPDWCFDYDDSDNSNVASSSGAAAKRSYDGDDDVNEEGDDQTNGDTKKKKRRRDRVVTNGKFMDGVSGVEMVTDAAIVLPLQRKVQEMCKWESNGFPGSQPVSMDRENITLLYNEPYLVSWKADGTRYMLLINKADEVYFFDRNFCCYQVNQISFPKSFNFNDHLRDTLLDGEMVLDNVGGVMKPRYLVYDIVYFHGKYIGKENFPTRLQCIKEQIVDARNNAIKSGLLRKELESFGVHNKPFWKLSQTASLLSEKFAKTLLHEPDGLIFQPSKDPYIGGQCERVLKWKPHRLNSIDFRLVISMDSGPGVVEKKIGLLYVGGLDRPFDRIKYSESLAKFKNKIIECTINDKYQWEFMRERTDKSLPNSFNTAVSVLNSIKYPVTEEYLLSAIEKFAYKGQDRVEDKSRMAPPKMSVQPAHHQQHHQQQQQQHHHHHQQHRQQQHHHHQQQPNPQHEDHHHQQPQQQHHMQQPQFHHHQQQQRPHQDEDANELYQEEDEDHEQLEFDHEQQQSTVDENEDHDVDDERQYTDEDDVDDDDDDDNDHENKAVEGQEQEFD